MELLPEAGDEVGPYLLRRELGRGAFARVFLAEQADLENRQVVVKLSTRSTREPWLLARARHAHIVEILSHAEVDDGAFQLICMPFLGGATLKAVLDRRRGRSAVRPRTRGNLLRDLDAVSAPSSWASTLRARAGAAGQPDRRSALAWVTARLAEALDHAFHRAGGPRGREAVEHPPERRRHPHAPGFQPGPGRLPSRPAGSRGNPGVHCAGTPAGHRGGRPSRGIPRVGESVDRASDGDGDVTGHDPHRSDLFALGMVLLEALTGTSPPPAAAGENAGPGMAKDPAELAASYASFREPGADVVLRSAESSAGS